MANATVNSAIPTKKHFQKKPYSPNPAIDLTKGSFARQVARAKAKQGFSSKFYNMKKAYKPGTIGSQDHAGLAPRRLRRLVAKGSGLVSFAAKEAFVPQYN